MNWTEDDLQALLKNPHVRIREQRPAAPQTAAPGSPATHTRADFDSDAEWKYYQKRVLPALQTGLITVCEIHKTFEILPALHYRGQSFKNREYTPDFYIEYRDGSVEVVEVKGREIKKRQRDYPIRRQIFLKDFCIPNHWGFIEIMDNQI